MKPYRVIVANPPWQFGDTLPGPTRGAEHNYGTMRTADIVDYFLARQDIAKDAVLFLWKVASMPGDALGVMGGWGFDIKTEMVWNKRTKTGKPWFGMGRIVRASHETCLIGTRGKIRPKIQNVRSTFSAKVPVDETKKKRPYIHSAKPDEFFSIVESLYDGPYLELFARKRRPGWDQIGDELEAAA